VTWCSIPEWNPKIERVVTRTIGLPLRDMSGISYTEVAKQFFPWSHSLVKVCPRKSFSLSLTSTKRSWTRPTAHVVLSRPAADIGWPLAHVES
jgi:hypothetical protein